MTLFGGRILLFFVAGTLVLGSLWGTSAGLIKFRSDHYKCFFGRKYYAAVPEQEWVSLGPIHLYYQPYTWGCPDGPERYDPRKYKKQNGTLVPIDS